MNKDIPFDYKWYKNNYKDLQSNNNNDYKTILSDLKDAEIEIDTLSRRMKRTIKFKKENKLYMVVESVNQRWLVELTSGSLNWLRKNGPTDLTTFIQSKGFIQIELPEGIFNVLARVNK